jgi:hypothetical protein
VTCRVYPILIVGDERIRILMLERNPFVRRALERRVARISDLALELFADEPPLARRVEQLQFRGARVDLVVYDARGLRPESVANARLVGTLVEGGVPVLVVVERELPPARDGVTYGRHPIGLAEILSIARSALRRPSHIRQTVLAPDAVGRHGSESAGG